MSAIKTSVFCDKVTRKKHTASRVRRGSFNVFQRAGRLAASCSNIAVGATTDGNRVFVQDVSNNIIRVLERKRVK